MGSKHFITRSSSIPLFGTGSCNFFIGGYIGQTFGPHAAETYVGILFKIDPKTVQWFCHKGAFYVWNQPVIATRPPDRIDKHRYAWLLDYQPVKSSGSVVPQKLWSPQGQGDRRRYVEQAQIQTPLFFVSAGGAIGVSIMNATAGQVYLHGEHEAAPFGGKYTTKIRICWPGYAPSEHQVYLRDQTPGGNVVTLKRFVKSVGSRIRQFLVECERVAVQDPGRNWKWRVAYDNISFNEVMLIGVVQVSAGSWMPILQLMNRVVM